MSTLDQFESDVLNQKAFKEGANWELEKVLLDNIVFNIEHGERKYLILALAFAVVSKPITSLISAIRLKQLPELGAELASWFLVVADLLTFGSITHRYARGIRLRNVFGVKFEKDSDFRSKITGHLIYANNVKILPYKALKLNDRLIELQQTLSDDELGKEIDEYWGDVGRTPPVWSEVGKRGRGRHLRHQRVPATCRFRRCRWNSVGISQKNQFRP